MKLLVLFLCLTMLTGCAAGGVPELETSAPPPSTQAQTAATEVPSEPETTQPPDPIRLLLDQMSLEERVGQLFLARCDADTAIQDISACHLGGFLLFAKDFASQTPDSLRETLNAYQNAAKIPLLFAVDEEGGTVTRISRYPAFRAYPFPSPRSSYAQGGMEQVLAIEQEKCTLLRQLGIQVNMGPVCDISDLPGAFLYDRSLGQDAQTTATFVSETVRLMNASQVGSVLKHFPGYGNNTDTHTGIAVDSRSLGELLEKDLVPFSAGIEAGCGAILVSHTIVEALDTEFPASLSPAVHRFLREQMGFTGVIVTDDLVMQAITDQYGADEAAVQAVLAGNDLLCSTDYVQQYQAVLSAVVDGRIDIDTLNSAAYHVLQWKTDLGLL